MSEFGFIGVGNMGGALAGAVCKKIGGEGVLVSDYSAEKAESFAKDFGCRATDNGEIAANAKFIFLGVKPQVLPSVAESLRATLAQREGRFVLVTMAAGISIASLEEMLGMRAPIIRIMPNTPVAVGEGMILYTANGAVSEDELDAFVSALSMAGKTDRIEEKLIDAASVISGCGPACRYMFLEAMTSAGEALGLDGKQARAYAEQTMIGAATLAASSPETLETLRVRVCSPGGSTIEGVKKFQALGLGGMTLEALNASYQRTLELGKKS